MSDVIYSASLASIGRTTHPAGTAAAHMTYIMRDGAHEHIVARGIPNNAIAAAAWINEQERGDRINARVCDKLMLALPHQLCLSQRITLVREYCEEMSRGVPYIAALHFPSRDGDQRNYHCHVVFRDRDPITGKRVMETTERGSVERFRERWEYRVNIAMADAGFDKRADRRSHAERAIDRVPGIHVGAAASNAARRASRDGKTPANNASSALPLCSRARRVRNSVDAHGVARVVEYPLIDGGFTRYEENEYRAAINARLSRMEAQAAQAAHLAAARASMTALGLGMVPGGLHQTLRTTGRSMFVQSRTTAAARAAMAEPMPLTLSTWCEAEALDRAEQRITVARLPRPLPLNAKASVARPLRDEAIVAAREHHAVEVASNRLAAARSSRALPGDAKAPVAHQLRDEAIVAAREHHTAEIASNNRLAVARSPRPLPLNAKASVARPLRDETIVAAREHHAVEVASNRLAAARSSRALPGDAKAPVACQLRAEAVAAAREHHAAEVADNRLAVALSPRPLVADAKATVARRVRADAAAAALEHHVAGNHVPPPPHRADIPAPLAAAFREDPSAEPWAAWWTEYWKPDAKADPATEKAIWYAWGEDIGTQRRENIKVLIVAWWKGGDAEAMKTWLATAPKLAKATVEIVMKSIPVQARSEPKISPIVKQPQRPVIGRGRGGKDDFSI